MRWIGIWGLRMRWWIELAISRLNSQMTVQSAVSQQLGFWLI